MSASVAGSGAAGSATAAAASVAVSSAAASASATSTTTAEYDTTQTILATTDQKRCSRSRSCGASSQVVDSTKTSYYSSSAWPRNGQTTTVGADAAVVVTIVIVSTGPPTTVVECCGQMRGEYHAPGKHIHPRVQCESIAAHFRNELPSAHSGIFFFEKHTYAQARGPGQLLLLIRSKIYN